MQFKIILVVSGFLCFKKIRFKSKKSDLNKKNPQPCLRSLFLLKHLYKKSCLNIIHLHVKTLVNQSHISLHLYLLVAFCLLACLLVYLVSPCIRMRRSCRDHNGRLYSVDLKVWSKSAKRARIKRIASKCAHEFDCDWQRVNAFSHCVTLTHVLVQQIIYFSD